MSNKIEQIQCKNWPEKLMCDRDENRVEVLLECVFLLQLLLLLLIFDRRLSIPLDLLLWATRCRCCCRCRFVWFHGNWILLLQNLCIEK